MSAAQKLDQNKQVFQKAGKICQGIINNISKAIQGKDPIIKKTLACWLSGGHLLLEDVPGTGKTILARSIKIYCN